MIFGKKLNVAFVGVKRKPSDFNESYWENFIRFHLELPYYFAKYSNCKIDVTTVEKINYKRVFSCGSSVRCITEYEYLNPEFDATHEPYDVVVHWRKWFDEFYMPSAMNVILSQDHSYSEQWKLNVKCAVDSKKLFGILVFPEWHKKNTLNELEGIVDESMLFDGLTFGVDTDIYYPDSDYRLRYDLLWASDPGRGLENLVEQFLLLWKKDRRYRLTVTYPDYVTKDSVYKFSQFFKHPGVRHIPNLRNCPDLWNLFNRSMFLPYTSNFKEPSSRCYRQAQAAGMIVMYPENMGTPSDIIKNNVDGIIVQHDKICDKILEINNDDKIVESISTNASNFAKTQNWEVQANKFYNFFVSKL